MTKEILLTAAGIAMAASPLAAPAFADSSGWSGMSATQAWTYETHRVERLAFGSDVMDPIKMGDAVLIAEPSASCHLAPCDVMAVSLMRDGGRVAVDGVPRSALDANLYAKNGDRFLFAKPSSEGVFAFYEWDLSTGQVHTRVSQVTMPGASNVSLHADNRGTYFVTADIRFSNARQSFTQRALYVYDAEARAVRPAVGSANFKDRRLDVLDAVNGVALVKMTFPDRSKQLWIFDSNHILNTAGRAFEIRGTWTDASGDIQFGRLLAATPYAESVHSAVQTAYHIEFFKQFVRHTMVSWIDEEPVRRGETLNWYGDPAASIKLRGDTMVWVNADQEVYESHGSNAKKLGTAVGHAFMLAKDGTVTFSPAGQNIWFTDRTASAGVKAGLDANGNVYLSQGNQTINVGFGTSPVVTSDARVYWRGTDGKIFAARLHTTPAQQTTLVSTVLMKRDGDPKVYAVANDGTVRHIATPAVAADLFGRDWPRHVRTVGEGAFVPYAVGAPITSAADAANLF